MADIIVVEDDGRLSLSIARYLSRQGHGVRVVGSGTELDAALQADPRVDIAILDIGLPDVEGTEIARRLKETMPIAVIMMTGRGEDEERIKGLDCGADYYLVKPVNLDELQAVIRSLMRRPGMTQPPRDRGWSLDTVGRRLITPAGLAVELTGAEFIFLNCVMLGDGPPVSRDLIADSLGYDRTQFLKGIESILARLRRKVQAVAGVSLPVKPVRGIGYVFADQIH